MRSLNDSPAGEQTAIFAKIGTIDHELSNAYSAYVRLEGAYSRVMSPAPSAVGKDATSSPTPNTLESRLQETGKAATSLAAQLHALADKFEKAI